MQGSPLVESDAEALQHYFPERDFVPLMEVLATVNRHSGWMEEFQHWQQGCLSHPISIFLAF